MNQYESLRKLMKTGDLIEWSPDSKVGRMIRWMTGRDVSHTSLVIRSTFPGLEEHVFLLEAVGAGVHPVRLSKVLEKFQGEAYWLALKPEYDLKRFAIGAWAIQTFVDAEPGYDYPGLFSNIIGRVALDGTRYYCSEWVQMAWTEANLIPKQEYVVHPGEFEQFGVTLPRVKLFE